MRKKEEETNWLWNIIAGIITFSILYSCQNSCINGGTDDASTSSRGSYNTAKEAYEDSQEHGRIKICGALQQNYGYLYELKLSNSLVETLPIENATKAWEQDEGRYICITGIVRKLSCREGNCTYSVYDAVRY